MPVPKGFKEKGAGFPSRKCAPKSFRIKELNGGKTRLVVCCPKGSWKNGRCKRGMKGTKIQTKMGCGCGK